MTRTQKRKLTQTKAARWDALCLAINCTLQLTGLAAIFAAVFYAANIIQFFGQM